MNYNIPNQIKEKLYYSIKEHDSIQITFDGEEHMFEVVNVTTGSSEDHSTTHIALDPEPDSLSGYWDLYSEIVDQSELQCDYEVYLIHQKESLKTKQKVISDISYPPSS